MKSKTSPKAAFFVFLIFYVAAIVLTCLPHDHCTDSSDSDSDQCLICHWVYNVKADFPEDVSITPSVFVTPFPFPYHDDPTTEISLESITSRSPPQTT